MAKILKIIKIHDMIQYVPDYGYENDRVVSDRVHRFIFGKQARIFEHVPYNNAPVSTSKLSCLKGWRICMFTMNKR